MEKCTAIHNYRVFELCDADDKTGVGKGRRARGTNTGCIY